MNQPRLPLLRALAGAACLCAALGAQAQSSMPQDRSTDSNVPPATAQKQAREIAQGDPARWFREDPSAAAAVRRLQKEIGAALQEAQGACRKLPAADRAGCMSEARANYQQDMAKVRETAYNQRS
jgi:hypothetical protein